MEEIDIKELLSLFWSKKIEIIIIVALLTIIGVIYSYTMVTPKYKASTTLVLATLKDSSTTSESITQADITINSKLVATYSELVKSKSVLREAIANLELEDIITEENLRKNITVTSLKDTEIIKITVENEDTAIAAELTNEIARIFAFKVREIYNVNNVYVVDAAEISEIPSNVNHLKDIAIFMAIGIVLGFSEVLAFKLLNYKVRIEQDIETSINLLVLGSLPKNEYLGKRRRA